MDVTSKLWKKLRVSMLTVPIKARLLSMEIVFEQMLPVLKRVSNSVSESPLQGASEDFSFYAKETPGLFIFLGITPKDQDPATAAPNHNPHFFVDESALVTGIRAMSSMAINYLVNAATTTNPK